MGCALSRSRRPSWHRPSAAPRSSPHWSPLGRSEVGTIENRNLRGRRVIVTGGAGFIGSHLVDRLIDEDPAAIVAVDNLWLGRRENLLDAERRRPDFVLHVADATNYRSMARIVAKHRPDVIFSLATIPLPASHVRPRWSAEAIVKMATVVAELARRGSVPALVHCSSSEVYGSAVTLPMSEDHPLGATTPYAAAKAAADLIIRAYSRTFGIEATIVRPFNNYGPRQNSRDYAGIVPLTLRRIQAGTPPVIYGDGEQTRDWIFARDTAEALVLAYRCAAARGRVINIAGGTEVKVRDLIALICEVAGWRGGVDNQVGRPADVRRHLGDARLASELLGFKPGMDLATGLKETVRWYLADPTRLAVASDAEVMKRAHA